MNESTGSPLMPGTALQFSTVVRLANAASEKRRRAEASALAALEEQLSKAWERAHSARRATPALADQHLTALEAAGWEMRAAGQSEDRRQLGGHGGRPVVRPQHRSRVLELGGIKQVGGVPHQNVVGVQEKHLFTTHKLER